MTNADILKTLFPLPLEGDFSADAVIEGAHFDAAQEFGNSLLEEIFPDTAYQKLTSWERVYNLVPSDGATIQSRRDAVLQNIRSRGGLSRAYFIARAAEHGWTITIDEFYPSMCGWLRCGDNLSIEGARWVWRVKTPSKATYHARVGISAAGERLTWWVSDTDMENLINRLKPAHTAVLFSYE